MLRRLSFDQLSCVQGKNMVVKMCRNDYSWYLTVHIVCSHLFNHIIENGSPLLSQVGKTTASIIASDCCSGVPISGVKRQMLTRANFECPNNQISRCSWWTPKKPEFRYKPETFHPWNNSLEQCYPQGNDCIKAQECYNQFTVYLFTHNSWV